MYVSVHLKSTIFENLRDHAYQNKLSGMSTISNTNNEITAVNT